MPDSLFPKPTPTPKKRLVLDLPQEQKDSIFMYGILGLGLYLLWKNRELKIPQQEYTSGDELYDKVKNTLTTDAKPNDSLDVVSRRLDHISKTFDPKAIERGTRFEMQRVGNEIVARSQAIHHLTHDPDYYEGIGEAG